MEVPLVSNEGTEEDLRRRFYSQCLAAKFTYAATHLAQNIQISGLYKRAIKKAVDEADWPTFIRTELDNAERWVRKNKRPRRKLNEEAEDTY
jgi:hypothetical protein